MSGEVIAAFIAVVGSVSAAIVSYWFTKQQEREAAWRREKLEHYKAFVNSLSGVVEGDTCAEGQLAYARACNNLLLFAPQRVIRALQQFQDEIRISNQSRSDERHDRLLSNLLLEIRRDLNITPEDVEGTFNVRLWASGVKSSKAA